MNIYSTFKPTYLYIKHHSVTGKMYFGKSEAKSEKELFKYTGSGTHWKNHINKHGKEYVETIWYRRFYDQESLTDFAIEFSESQNIVESHEWLNLKIEDGLNNGTTKHSPDTIERMRTAATGKRYSSEINAKKVRRGEENGMYGVHRFGKSAPMYGKHHSEETREIQRQKALNRPKKSCPHCGKFCQAGNAIRHHFDNCKLNPNLDKEAYRLKKMQGRVCRLSDRKEMDHGNWSQYMHSFESN